MRGVYGIPNHRFLVVRRHGCWRCSVDPAVHLMAASLIGTLLLRAVAIAFVVAAFWPARARFGVRFGLSFAGAFAGLGLHFFAELIAAIWSH